MLTDEEKTILAELRDELVAERSGLQSRKDELEKEMDAIEVSISEDDRRIDALTSLIGSDAAGATADEKPEKKAKAISTLTTPFKTLL